MDLHSAETLLGNLLRVVTIDHLLEQVIVAFATSFLLFNEFSGPV